LTSFIVSPVEPFSRLPGVYQVGNTRLGNEDGALLKRVQRGDQQAIAALYDRYARVVYSVALRVLGDPAPAEQILTAVFLEVWRSPKRFMQITGSLSPSLAMIARNRAVEMRLRKPPSDLAFAAPYGLLNQQERNTTREAACAAIDKLPMERRIMLERALFPGMTRSEIAAPMKSPANTEEDLGGLVSTLADTGLVVFDLHSDPSFAQRQLHVRDVASQIEGMNRLARAFVDSPTTILQELVTAAVDLCGADSAGISVEQKDGTDDNFWHWVATAGQYSGFVDAKLPRYPSACGLTLERGRPQIFRVTKRFFDLMGVQAPIVTDGMLLPWQADETRGTIWIMAHGRAEAFDGEDCKMMQALASFAATGVKLQRQQRLQMEQARTAAEAAMANDLAHQINNPLQGLMQTVFLFGRGGAESGVFAQQAMGDLVRLSDLVKRLLSSRGQT
jgi:DNA-directed RNA polymerase specialized sigma24 family protein